MHDQAVASKVYHSFSLTGQRLVVAHFHLVKGDYYGLNVESSPTLAITLVTAQVVARFFIHNITGFLCRRIDLTQGEFCGTFARLASS